MATASRLALEDEKPKPLVGGRHLIARGHKPGKEFSVILKACFEAQLDGVFTDEAGGEEFLDRTLANTERAAMDAEIDRLHAESQKRRAEGGEWPEYTGPGI